MKITMAGVLKLPMEVEQIICDAADIQKRIRYYERRGYEVLEIKTIDRYTTLMRFYKGNGK